MNNVAINASNLHSGGGVQVATSFIRELSKYSLINKDNLTLILSNTVYDNLLSLNTSLKGFKSILIMDVHGISGLSIKNSKVFAKFDVVFTIFGPFYSLNKKPRNIVGFAQPWIIYPDNEIFNRIPVFKKFITRTKFWLQKKFFFRADHIIVELEHVKNKLEHDFSIDGDKISVVYNTFSDVYKIPLSELPRVCIPEHKDIINIGLLSRDYPHKNIDILPKVKNILKSEYNVDSNVIVTLDDNEWSRKSDFFRDNVLNIGPLNVSQCPSFYEQIDILLFPSLLECFSATPLEAMITKTPLFASDRGFVRDVCKEHAIYINPLDEYDIARKINNYLLSLSIDLDSANEHATNFSNSYNRAKCYCDIINMIGKIN